MQPKNAAWALAVFCLFPLFYNLGKPAFWQDEAETALYGRSILQYGYPNAHLGDNLITAQPSLAKYETNARGVWIWNTWLPCYVTALSYLAFGESTWSARLPFAIFGFLSFCLAVILFRQWASTDAQGARAAFLGSLFLAFNVPWFLFLRQCRYYSLVCFGTLAAVLSYQMLLRKQRWGPFALAASLLFLLHSFFVFCPLMLLVLGTDAFLRKDEPDAQKQFSKAALAVIILSLPVAWYFKIWIRPGNHLYALPESLAFLRTFLLWTHQFIIASPILFLFLMQKSGRWAAESPRPREDPRGKAIERLRVACRNSRSRIAFLSAAYLVFLFTLEGEGPASSAATAAVFAALILAAVRIPAPKGELGAGRTTLLLTVFTLGAFSFAGAEPYGRYMIALIPFFCYAMGYWITELSASSGAEMFFWTSLLLSSNLLYALPVQCVRLLHPSLPAESVSGMMRQRLKDVTFRSDALSFAGELIRGPQGYVEAVSDYISHHAMSSDTAFSDADNLSYMFYTGLHFIGPEALKSAAPEWIFPSAWLAFDAETKDRLQELLRRSASERIEVEAPILLWQNNPDILYHKFNPHIGKQVIFHIIPDKR